MAPKVGQSKNQKMEFPFIDQVYQILGNHLPEYIVQAIIIAIFFGLISLPISIVAYFIRFHKRKMEGASRKLDDLETFYMRELSKIELENALLKIELLKRDNDTDELTAPIERASETP